MKYIEVDYSIDPPKISQSGCEKDLESIAQKIGLDECDWVAQNRLENGGKYELCTHECLDKYRQLFPGISANAESIDGDGFVLFFWEDDHPVDQEYTEGKYEYID